MGKRCNSKCIYFPNQSYEKAKTNYYFDDNGVKHSKTRCICGFDDHLITNWKDCDNYKDFIKPLTFEENKDKTIVLLGKSGSGKDFVLNYLKNIYGFNSVVSHTTRLPREAEVDGKDYHFVTVRQFTEMMKANEFIETRDYTTNFNGQTDVWYYGTSKEEFDNKSRKVCIVDKQGFLELKKYNESKIVSIYIDCDDKLREERAKLRGSFSQSEWDRRLKDDNKKFKNLNTDYIITNNSSLEELEKNITKILEKEELI